VLTAKSRVPSGESARGRTGPLSKVTNDACAAGTTTRKTSIAMVRRAYMARLDSTLIPAHATNFCRRRAAEMSARAGRPPDAGEDAGAADRLRGDEPFAEERRREQRRHDRD